MNRAVDARRPQAPAFASRWPARLDLIESATGIALALFMWAHMGLVASILLGEQAMWTVARLFEGYYFTGQSQPIMVAAIVAVVIALFLIHGLLAMRKIPASYAEYHALRGHTRRMRHAETTLWSWQVVTGLALFILAAPHLYLMLTRPDRIGPYASADRVWTETLWPLYLVLLFVVEIHAGIGLYRAALKWGWPARLLTGGRRRARALKWVVTTFFIALGLATLAAYVRIGIEHAPAYGERYVPGAPAGGPGG
jgi:fumarate reductase subunit C